MTATTHASVRFAGVMALAVAAVLCVRPAPVAAQTLPTSCVSFSDDPVTAGVTVVKAQHLTELRACINDLRAQVSLGAYAWTDPTLTPGQTFIRAVHITDLRSALSAVYTAHGAGAPSYGEAITAGSTIVRASHINELRSFARSVPGESPPAAHLSSLVPDKSSPQQAGTTITWTAAGTGGTTPYSFKFLLSMDAGATWQVVQDWSTTPTYVWRPAAIDPNYRIQAWIRSASNQTNSYEDTLSQAFSVTSSSVVISDTFTATDGTTIAGFRVRRRWCRQAAGMWLLPSTPEHRTRHWASI